MTIITDEATGLVPVIQEDREAAANIVLRLLGWSARAGYIRAKACDDMMVVQAFAAHRIAAVNSHDALVREVVTGPAAASHFDDWTDASFISECRAQARNQLDPEFSAFMTTLANRLEAIDLAADSRGEGATFFKAVSNAFITSEAGGHPDPDRWIEAMARSWIEAMARSLATSRRDYRAAALDAGLLGQTGYWRDATAALRAILPLVAEEMATAARDTMVDQEWPPQDGDRQIDEVIWGIRTHAAALAAKLEENKC